MRALLPERDDHFGRPFSESSQSTSSWLWSSFLAGCVGSALPPSTFVACFPGWEALAAASLASASTAAAAAAAAVAAAVSAFVVVAATAVLLPPPRHAARFLMSLPLMPQPRPPLRPLLQPLLLLPPPQPQMALMLFRPRAERLGPDLWWWWCGLSGMWSENQCRGGCRSYPCGPPQGDPLWVRLCL